LLATPLAPLALSLLALLASLAGKPGQQGSIQPNSSSALRFHTFSQLRVLQFDGYDLLQKATATTTFRRTLTSLNQHSLK